MFGHRRSRSLLCESGILTASAPCDADLQHRIQLETYQRDPRKSAAAKRLAEQGSLRSPTPPTPPKFTVTDFDDDDTTGKGRRRSVNVGKYHYHYLSLRAYAETIRYAALVVLVTLCIICTVRFSAMVSESMAREGESAAIERITTTQNPPPAAYSRVRLAHRDRERAARLGRENHMVSNGLLHVNMNSTTHPIQQLIADAQAKWNAKNAKQSKTLRQAMIEYKRRYKQAPPKGFELWWAYVQEHNVALPDEYDQIAHDLAPYRALSPSNLNDRLNTASKKQGTFTLQIADGKLSSSTSSEADGAVSGRLTGEISLIKSIAQHLPDMNIVYSAQDTPHNLLSYNHRMDLLEAASGGEYINAHEEIDTSLRGLAAACSASSPLRRSSLEMVSGKTFVADLSQYTDLCNHPSLFKLHGSLIGKDPVVNELSPMFSLSKTSLHADVLGVPTEQWVDIKEVPAWEARSNNKLLWRGSTTGMHHSNKYDWRSNQRTRLVETANSHSEEKVSTLVAKAGQSLEDSQVEKSIKELNERMDISFSGKPIQCEEPACADLASQYTWAPERMSHNEALGYKYVIDVDGNAWSARFERLLQSGSLIFKSTIMPEWYSDRIQPWVHFVPVQVDYSDLHDILSFFRPDGDNTGEDVLAAQMGSAGRQWAKSHWRKEDMIAYAFRLYLEWGRLVASNREGMDFVYSSEMEQ